MAFASPACGATNLIVPGMLPEDGTCYGIFYRSNSFCVFHPRLFCLPHLNPPVDWLWTRVDNRRWDGTRTNHYNYLSSRPLPISLVCFDSIVETSLFLIPVLKWRIDVSVPSLSLVEVSVLISISSTSPCLCRSTPLFH